MGQVLLFTLALNVQNIPTHIPQDYIFHSDSFY